MANSKSDAAPPDVNPTTFIIVFFVIYFILFHYGAASLSYAKYHSLPWAFVNFIFAEFYYPFYALVLNTSSTNIRRR
jgi:hypothetical protein